MEKVILMLIPENISSKWAQKHRGIGNRLLRYFGHVKEDLKEGDLDIRADEYMAKALLNAVVMSILFGSLMSFIFWVKGQPIANSIALGFAIFLGVTILFLMIYVRYPSIMADKKAERINKDLVFALKDVSLQISAGVSLYDSFLSVSRSGYGSTSEEFRKVISKVDTGTPLNKAIEEMAISTKSEYLKRTSWQIVNSVRSGSNLKKTLKRIIEDLSSEHRNKIKNYARELNMWSLLYMLFAVAIPTIGSTMMVILSSFAGFGITKGLFIMFIVICFIVQYVLIGLIKSRRPISNV